jgi:MraZ protein
MKLFLYNYVNKLDRKGRISVPAEFRSALAELGFDSFAAFCSFRSPAIECWTPARLEQLTLAMDDLNLFSEQQETLATTLFANTKPISFDGEGRITLPPEFLTHAGITADALFVGQGQSFQIWEPKAYERAQAAALERARKGELTLKLKAPTP